MASLFIHAFVKCKIKFLEMKQKQSVNPIPNSMFVNKLDDISFIQNHTISDYVTNIVALCSCTLLIATTTLVNKMDPSGLSQYPNYLLVYFLHFALPLLFTGSIMVLYYGRHQPLRASLLREAKTRLGLYAWWE